MPTRVVGVNPCGLPIPMAFTSINCSNNGGICRNGGGSSWSGDNGGSRSSRSSSTAATVMAVIPPLLRTVILQILIPSPIGVLEIRSSHRVRVPDWIRGWVLETMWLQLMCCALSDFSSSQFMNGSDFE